MSLVIVGVGGQGILTLANLVCRAALRQDLPVVASETHGMSQRGGSVASHIRFEDGVSPRVRTGQASVLLGLEPVETVRALDRANASTTIVTSMRPRHPIGVVLGREVYPAPEALLEEMRRVSRRIFVVDAEQVAKGLGDIRMANTVMLGALVGTAATPLKLESARMALEDFFPPKYAQPNLQALDIGCGLVTQQKDVMPFA